MAPQPRGDARRDAILAFVEKYCDTHGFGPSMREIAAGVGLRHASSAIYQVRLLVAAGCLSEVPGLPRTIRVVES